MNETKYQHALDAYRSMYTEMQPETLHRIGDYFTDDAVFQDPFNKVRGAASIRRIFEHMYQTCDHPKFNVMSTALTDNTAWLHWDFTCTVKGHDLCITGASMVLFADDGRVMMHMDYWDAASQVYEKLPVIGWFVRRLRNIFALPMHND